MRTGDLIEVVWYDANTCQAVAGENYTPNCEFTWTGYYAGQNHRYVVMTPMSGGSRATMFAVPKNCIIKRRVIKRADPKGSYVSYAPSRKKR